MAVDKKLDIGGEKILGITIPKIPIAAKIKEFLGAPPGVVLKEEAADAVKRGVMVPIVIGAVIIGLAIVGAALAGGSGKGHSIG